MLGQKVANHHRTIYTGIENFQVINPTAQGLTWVIWAMKINWHHHSCTNNVHYTMEVVHTSKVLILSR